MACTSPVEHGARQIFFCLRIASTISVATARHTGIVPRSFSSLSPPPPSLHERVAFSSQQIRDGIGESGIPRGAPWFRLAASTKGRRSRTTRSAHRGQGHAASRARRPEEILLRNWSAEEAPAIARAGSPGKERVRAVLDQLRAMLSDLEVDSAPVVADHVSPRAARRVTTMSDRRMRPVASANQREPSR